MRRVIGLGETILDILFIGNQPHAAVPGGSVYNSIISLSRMGCQVSFISETGNDRPGQIILEHMQSNGVDTHAVSVFDDGRSPISLAFINEHNDADYVFYKDYPNQRLECDIPSFERDDILMIGSYFALNPQLRPKVKEIIEYARKCGAIIYYDVNFRSSHRHEAIRLMPTLIENLEYADIVRGSCDDFSNLFGTSDAERVYRNNISYYCPRFIWTDAERDLQLFTPEVRKNYAVPPIKAVSTVGAGDNFNAGVIFALIKQRIRRDDLPDLTTTDWDNMIEWGIRFSSDVCQQYQNSVSDQFVQQFR